jgi:tRNA threonylcarbamoyladenosine biosynthesis protein TsaB
MRILLGLDTATSATAVALRLADGTTVEARDDPASGEHPGHATRLLDLIAGLLDQTGLDWGQIELIAVGLGPGAFTGLRIGLASARGLAQSLAVEVCGVSSLMALAQPALTAPPVGAPPRRVLAVLDARRGEVFLAAYDLEGELISPRAIAPQDLPALLESSEPNGCWLAVGDGALRFSEVLQGAGVTIAPADSPLHLIAATSICDLGEKSAITHVQELIPDYCRRPDAEIALEGATK